MESTAILTQKGPAEMLFGFNHCTVPSEGKLPTLQPGGLQSELVIDAPSASRAAATSLPNKACNRTSKQCGIAPEFKDSFAQPYRTNDYLTASRADGANPTDADTAPESTKMHFEQPGEPASGNGSNQSPRDQARYIGEKAIDPSQLVTGSGAVLCAPSAATAAHTAPSAELGSSEPPSTADDSVDAPPADKVRERLGNRTFTILRNAMLQQQDAFMEQLWELHRLTRVQHRKVMLLHTEGVNLSQLPSCFDRSTQADRKAERRSLIASLPNLPSTIRSQTNGPSRRFAPPDGAANVESVAYGKLTSAFERFVTAVNDCAQQSMTVPGAVMMPARAPQLQRSAASMATQASQPNAEGGMQRSEHSLDAEGNVRTNAWSGFNAGNRADLTMSMRHPMLGMHMNNMAMMNSLGLPMNMGSMPQELRNNVQDGADMVSMLNLGYGLPGMSNMGRANPLLAGSSDPHSQWFHKHNADHKLASNNIPGLQGALLHAAPPPMNKDCSAPAQTFPDSSYTNQSSSPWLPDPFMSMLTGGNLSSMGGMPSGSSSFDYGAAYPGVSGSGLHSLLAMQQQRGIHRQGMPPRNDARVGASEGRGGSQQQGWKTAAAQNLTSERSISGKRGREVSKSSGGRVTGANVRRKRSRGKKVYDESPGSESSRRIVAEQISSGQSSLGKLPRSQLQGPLSASDLPRPGAVATAPHDESAANILMSLKALKQIP